MELRISSRGARGGGCREIPSPTNFGPDAQGIGSIKNRPKLVGEGEHLGEVISRMSLERATKEGESPVGENNLTLLGIYPEYHRERKPCGKQAGLPAKAKYSPTTDSALSTVRER